MSVCVNCIHVYLFACACESQCHMFRVSILLAKGLHLKQFKLFCNKTLVSRIRGIHFSLMKFNFFHNTVRPVIFLLSEELSKTFALIWFRTPMIKTKRKRGEFTSTLCCQIFFDPAVCLLNAREIVNFSLHVKLFNFDSKWVALTRKLMEIWTTLYRTSGNLVHIK